MPEDEVTRKEHDEFSKRLDEHLSRLDARVEDVETDVADLKHQTAAIDRLATNMQHMCDEQKKQGERLERLESRDGQKYRQLISYVCTAVVSVLAGVIVAVLTMGL